MTTYLLKHTRSLVVFWRSGFSGEIPLNLKPSENKDDRWRETFCIPQKPTRRQTPPSLWTLWLRSDIMSCWVSCSPAYHLEESRHIQSRSCTYIAPFKGVHLHLAQTPLSLVRRKASLTMFSLFFWLSKCDKTHEGLRSNWGDLQCHDRFTTLLLQTYIQWNIYSVSVSVIYCR